jgi:signal transduction histidine kinase
VRLIRAAGPALAACAAELALLLNDGHAGAAAIVLTLAAAGALAVRERAPLAVLAVALASAAAIAAVGEMAAGVTVLVALYTVADVCERRVSLIALAPVIAATAAISVAGPEQPVVSAVTSAVLAAGVWGLGAYVRAQRRELMQLAVQEERTAIARELHDIVAHSVTVMLLGVRGARDVLRTRPDAAEDALAQVEASGERSLVELRRILALLRGAGEAPSRPQPSLAELGELVAEHRAAGLPVRLQVTGEARPLPAGVELSAYRIVQEALTNAAKHAAPRSVVVTVAFRGAGLDVEVLDDGGAGQGLVGMRERVALLGGELEAGRVAAGGYRVAARLPA